MCPCAWRDEESTLEEVLISLSASPPSLRDGWTFLLGKIAGKNLEASEIQ